MQNVRLWIFSCSVRNLQEFIIGRQSMLISGHRREYVPADDDELDSSSEIAGDTTGFSVTRFAFQGFLIRRIPWLARRLD